MNKKTWIIALLVVVVVILLLTTINCGSSPKKIEIGATFPLSGEVASAGQRIKNGIELAVSEINQDRDRPEVHIIFEDDQNKPAQAVGNAKKFIDIDKVVAILGSAASGCTRAMMPYARQKETVVLSPISSSVSLSEEGGRFFFRVCPADDEQAKVAASWIIENKKGPVAIVYVNNDWGRSLAESVRDRLTGQSVEVVTYEGVAEGQKDLRTILEKVRKSGANVLYSSTYPIDGGLLVRQARELGLSVELIGGDNWGTPEFQTTAGSAVDACLTIKAINPGGEAYDRFAGAYKQKYGEAPDNFATWSYDATKALVSAIDKADGQGGINLANTLRETDTVCASGRIAFDENGDLLYPRFGVFKYSGTDMVPVKGE